MDQLILSLVLSIGAARILRAPNKPNDSLSVATQPPLPLTPQRLKLIKALTKEMSGSPDERIAQPAPQQSIIAQDAPRPGGQAQPSQLLLVLPRKIWALLSVLIFVALLPNFTLVPLLWLRFLERPASTQATITAHQSSTADQSIDATQATLRANRTSIVDPPTATTPVLSAPSIVESTIGEHVSFPIAIDGTDGMPPSSRIVIRGLPSGSKLSNGHRGSDSEWNLNPDEIGDLHLVSGNNVINDTKLAIQLVAPDGRIVADTATILKRTMEPQASAMASGIEAPLTGSQVSSEQPVEIIGLAPKPMGPEADLPTADPAPSPARKPQPDNDDIATKWVKPSTSVNLRKGPSSSAAIISVIERATKLRVMGRKKGWVQVTNLATSETGWIYAGNIGAAR
jgi:SH3 domain-containing protein